MRAAIYARLSMDRDGTSTAVERQEADCTALCEQRGWDIEQVFADNDVSAYSGKKRPGFERMLKALADGCIETVVVWKSDRLARRGRDLQRFLDAAEPHGVTLTSVTEPEFAGPAGLMMLRLVNSFAEHESSVKSERVARANKERAAAGKPHGGGGRKFGYTVDFEPHPVEAALLREAVARTLKGESGHAIVADWNERGLTTVAGVRWRPSNFGRMLRAPLYAGLRSYHGELLPGSWPALVKRTEWDMLQAILVARPRNGKAITRHLLTGLLQCAACEGPMIGTFHHGHTEYRCDQDRGCGRVSIRSAIVEPFVSEAVAEHAPVWAAQQLAPQLRSHLVLSGRLTALSEAVDALSELETARWVDRAIDQATYARLRGQLQGRIDAARAEIGSDNAVAQLVGVDVGGEWDGQPLSWRRQVLEAMVERIVVKPGRSDRLSIEWAA